MANDQRDMNTGGRSGTGNQPSDSRLGSQPGMGEVDSGITGAQDASTADREDMGGLANQGGLGSDLASDFDVEGGDAGRGSSSGSSRTLGGDTGGMSGARSGEGGM